MKLKPFVSADKVVLNLESGSQGDILKQLMLPLVKVGNMIANEEEFLSDLITRENEVTTVMENGIAFPHARSEAVNRLCLVVGLAPDGIQFSPEKGNTSKVIFLIGVPSFAPTAHIPILQSLATFAKDEVRLEKLLAAPYITQFLQASLVA